MNSLRGYEILRQIMLEGCVSSKYLAQKFALSSRTIRNELQEWMPLIRKNGAVLLVQRGVGYRLEIQDSARFETFLEKLYRKEPVPSTACDRIRYILKLLLDHSGEFMKQEVLADQLYVSRNTISSDFRKIKKCLKQYDLSLIGRSGYGISLNGKERNIRRILVQMIKEEADDIIQGQMDSIFKILVKIIGESGIKLSKLILCELSALLLVTVKRIETGRAMELDQEKLFHIQKGTEYEAARKIADSLTEMFHVAFAEAEIGNIAIFLACSRIFNLSEMPDYVVKEEVTELAEKMMEAACGYCHLDMKGDKELKNALITHLIPMLERLRYHWPQENPMLTEIKKRYILGYVIADAACKPLEGYIHSRISEDEKGYLAIHFESALSGMYNHIDKSVLVIGTVGKAASQSLVRTIKKWFGEELLKVDACDITRLNEIDLKEYDCILTTTAPEDRILPPYLIIPQFLTEKDYPLLRKFLIRPEKEVMVRNFLERAYMIHLHSCEKEDILKEIALMVSRNYGGDDFDSGSFFTYVYAANASTSVVVISCSQQGTETCRICLAVPEKTVVWDKQKADFILYINMSEALDRNFYYLIQALSEELSENSGRNLEFHCSEPPR